jgi:hypothetical protein
MFKISPSVKRFIKEAFILPGYLLGCFVVIWHFGDKTDLEDWYEYSSLPLFKRNKRWVPSGFSVAFKNTL